MKPIFTAQVISLRVGGGGLPACPSRLLASMLSADWLYVLLGECVAVVLFVLRGVVDAFVYCMLCCFADIFSPFLSYFLYIVLLCGFFYCNQA